jgi:hypothetical protein
VKELLDGVVVGEKYVCLDGMIIPSKESVVRVEGWHSSHDLPYVPHVEAMHDPAVLSDVLASEVYWRGTAI